MTEFQEILKAAVEAVESAQVPEDLRGIAFSKAIDALSGQSSQSTALIPGDSASADSNQGDSIAAIANKLGLPASEVSQVYRIEDGEVALDLPGSVLPSSKKHAQQAIALLVSAGRQAAGEDLTSIALIRETCDDYGVKDGNFATNMKDLDDVLARRQDGKFVKVRIPGFERAAARIREFLSGGSS